MSSQATFMAFRCRSGPSAVQNRCFGLSGKLTQKVIVSLRVEMTAVSSRRDEFVLCLWWSQDFDRQSSLDYVQRKIGHIVSRKVVPKYDLRGVIMRCSLGSRVRFAEQLKLQRYQS